MLSATYVFLSVVGGITAPPYPLAYALVSFLVTFHPMSVGCPLDTAAPGSEAIMAFGPDATPGAAAAFSGHAGSIAVFAVLNVAFLHAEAARQRRAEIVRAEVVPETYSRTRQTGLMKR